MIDVTADRATVRSAMTLAEAKALLMAGVGIISGPISTFDLAEVTAVDSSGLAVVFGWLREAKRLGKSIRIVNVPQNLSSLAEVYGVKDLLPVA